MATDQASDSPPRSLTEEQQQLTRSRIRQAAMEVVARRGFDATVDEIAQLSGVSPRTIFRHYKTQSDLIAATLQDMIEAGARPIEGLPRPSDDLDGWLEGLSSVIHTRNAEIFGNVIWDLHAPSASLPAKLSEMIAARLDYRRNAIQHVVAVAWQAAGGMGPAPHWLVSVFTVNLSAFTTQTLRTDRDQTPAQVGALTAHVLKVLLRYAVDEQRAVRTGVVTATTTNTDED
jgi:AcrR family transcriptional regulator